MILAVQRSLSSLGRGRVWLYILGPALVALLFMGVLALLLLDYLISSFIEQPPMSWLAQWGAFWLAKVLAVLGGWLAILSASYLVAMLLTALVVLPLMLNFLAQADYPDLARLGRDSVLAGAWNSIVAALLFLVGWVLTLPLWLVPGMALVLPLFWMAWLNRRTFAFDALAVHATDDEWRTLRWRHGGALLLLGGFMALLAYIPFMGLLAPSLTALAYLHYCLEALRRQRGEAVVSVPAGHA